MVTPSSATGDLGVTTLVASAEIGGSASLSGLGGTGTTMTPVAGGTVQAVIAPSGIAVTAAPTASTANGSGGAVSSVAQIAVVAIGGSSNGSGSGGSGGSGPTGSTGSGGFAHPASPAAAVSGLAGPGLPLPGVVTTAPPTFAAPAEAPGMSTENPAAFSNPISPAFQGPMFGPMPWQYFGRSSPDQEPRAGLGRAGPSAPIPGPSPSHVFGSFGALPATAFGAILGALLGALCLTTLAAAPSASRWLRLAGDALGPPALIPPPDPPG